jgi:hypothetical protein
LSVFPHFQASLQRIKAGDRDEGLRDAFEEAGILDNVDSTLVIAERYRDLPSVLIRTFVYDSISRLDDLARECRGYVGKVMDYICEELRGLLYEAFEESEDFGGETG